jgi:uncharacterized protein (TIGR02646 family)
VIRIRKPKKRPAVLTNRGKKKTRELQKAHDAGQRTFSDFDRTIYGPQEVKDALRQAQHGKCAFCESRTDHVSYGDVEHYRPKAAVAQKEGDPYDRPGYYWLAYEWHNLFFCCQLCNQRFKRNLFPLRDPGARARSHNDDLNREQPLLIDPAATDPTLHVGFRDELAYPMSGSEEGRATIEVMGLNRIELLEKRRDTFRRLRVLRNTRDALRAIQSREGTLPPDLQTVLTMHENEIQAATFPEAEYSSMARALFT